MSEGRGDASWNDPRQVEADAFNQARDQVRDHNAELARDKGFEEPARGGLLDRVRRALTGGSAPPAPAEPEVPEAQVWERETERRAEYEQERANSDSAHEPHTS